MSQNYVFVRCVFTVAKRSEQERKEEMKNVEENFNALRIAFDV